MIFSWKNHSFWDLIKESFLFSSILKMSAATFYNKKDFNSGNSNAGAIVVNGPVTFPVLKYIIPHLGNNIASLKVSLGYKATLCTGHSFQGTCKTFIGPTAIADLVPFKLGNNAESLKVEYVSPPSGTPPSPLPYKIYNGEVVQCTTTKGEVPIYRIENNQKLHYPGPTVYQSWGSPPAKTVDCTILDLIPDGPDMPDKSKLPALPIGTSNGDVAECYTTGKVYYIQDNQKRHFPNPPIYTSWGSPPPTAIVSCANLDKIPSGPDMPYNADNFHPPIAAWIYQGTSLSGNAMALPPDFISLDLNNTPIGQNSLQSICVNPGYTVTLYRATNLNSSIDNVPIPGPVKIPVLSDANMKIRANVSSLKVTGSGLPAKPIGKTIDGVIQQKSTYIEYGGHCLDGDWELNGRCVGLYEGTCPNVGNSSPIKTNWTHPQANSGSDGGQITCTYDIGTFTNINSAANTWLTTNWIDQNQAIAGYNSIFMPYYCPQQVTLCPSGMDNCSRFVSTGDGGDACRTWATTSWKKTSPYKADNADTAMVNYCDKYKTSDCACLNRKEDPLYQQVTKTGYHFGDAQCWWKPCQTNGTLKDTLVTSGLATKCTTNVCAQFQNFTTTQLASIKQSQISQKISCNLPTPGTPNPGGNQGTPGNQGNQGTPGGNQGNPGNQSGNQGNPGGTPNLGGSSGSSGSSIWLWLGIGGGLLLLLIIIGIGVYYYEYK